MSKEEDSLEDFIINGLPTTKNLAITVNRFYRAYNEMGDGDLPFDVFIRKLDTLFKEGHINRKSTSITHYYWRKARRHRGTKSTYKEDAAAFLLTNLPAFEENAVDAGTMFNQTTNTTHTGAAIRMAAFTLFAKNRINRKKKNRIYHYWLKPNVPKDNTKMQLPKVSNKIRSVLPQTRGSCGGDSSDLAITRRESVGTQLTQHEKSRFLELCERESLTLSVALRSLVVEAIEKQDSKIWYKKISQTEENKNKQTQKAHQEISKRIEGLERDIATMQEQSKKIESLLQEKELDNRLANLEIKKDEEQQKLDLLEERLRKWNTDDLKVRSGILK